MTEPEFNNRSISIERAVPDNAEIICEIRDEAWIDTYPNERLGITPEAVKINAQGLNGEFIPRRIAGLKAKIAANNGTWIAYVAKVDGVVRGVVIASTDGTNRKFLNSLYVKPGFQGKGLGAKLMQRALNWLGNREDIYLEVTSYNDNAIRFYERFGFEKTNNKIEEEPNRPSFMIPVPQIEMVRRASSD